MLIACCRACRWAAGWAAAQPVPPQAPGPSTCCLGSPSRGRSSCRQASSQRRPSPASTQTTSRPRSWAASCSSGLAHARTCTHLQGRRGIELLRATCPSCRRPRATSALSWRPRLRRCHSLLKPRLHSQLADQSWSCLQRHGATGGGAPADPATGRARLLLCPGDAKIRGAHVRDAGRPEAAGRLPGRGAQLPPGRGAHDRHPHQCAPAWPGDAQGAWAAPSGWGGSLGPRASSIC